MRYLITGGSGYIGTRLIKALEQQPNTERVLIADVQAPRAFPRMADYLALDVRDAGRLKLIVERERPDVVVHLAGLMHSGGDQRGMYETNVAGTGNVLEAIKNGGAHVVVLSSAAAYGPARGKVSGLDEEAPLASAQDFEYGRHFVTADRLCQLWAARHTDRVISIVRSSLVLGPTVDNPIVKLWTDAPFHARFADPDDSLQLVHEDDLVAALLMLIERRDGGVFNVAGEGTVLLRECAELTGLKQRRVPRAFYSKVARQGKSLQGLGFIKRPPLVATTRLRARTGWCPSYTSRETFEIAIQAQGRLVGAPKTTPIAEASLEAPPGLHHPSAR